MRQCSCCTTTAEDWRARFLKVLPKLRRFAAIAFRSCGAELREELVAEAVGRCYCAYHRLVELEREHDAHPSVLMAFAVKQVGIGLRLGSSRNRFDATSRYCQLQSGVNVTSLHTRRADGEWRELAIESKHATPADTAVFRIDFGAWLDALSPRDRAIALLLASGAATSQVAEDFRLSSGRVSQLRRELARSWFLFQGLGEDGRDVDLAA